MRVDRISGWIVSIVFLCLTVSSTEVSGQSQSRRRGVLFGDWRVKMDFNGREFESILSFSRNSDGQRTAQWISFRGISELKDVKLEDGQLSFVRERQSRDGETRTSKFKGTIQDGKLTGVFSGDGEDRKVQGARSQRTPRAVGNWDLKFKIGEREISNTLVVAQGKDDQLAVDWKSERVEHKISDVKYERGKLTFKSQAKLDNRQWKSTFEATIQRNALTGTITTDRGEVTVGGTLAGAPIIGTWNLDVASERGDRKQRMIVRSDMTGLYGSTPIKKVTLEDDKVSFKLTLKFGEREFEMNFKGTVKDSALTGELTTSRGTSKITGKRRVARQRQRRERRQDTI